MTSDHIWHLLATRTPCGTHGFNKNNCRNANTIPEMPVETN